MSKITQAVILSAGFGTRLREVTGEDLPKVMMPVLDKPLLQWHIQQLKKFGVREFFVNLHYLPKVITDYFGDGNKFGVKIHYSLEEPEILGTAGGLKGFENKLSENFFVIYGDILSLANYGKIAEAFYQKPKGTLGMELVGQTDHPHDSDLAEIDEELRFLKIYRKPHRAMPERYESMKGIFVFNKKIFSYIPKDKYYEIDHQVLPEALEKGEKFYGYKCSDFLRDIGTPERYKATGEYLKSLKT